MDRRVTPANDRVVIKGWADKFPHLTPVTPREQVIAVAAADLSFEPGGARARQLAYGSGFDVLEVHGAHAFGVASAPYYVGWIAKADLADWRDDYQKVVWVCRRQTHAYSEPDFKSRAMMALPHLSILLGRSVSGRFVETEQGWVPKNHVTEEAGGLDIADVAELYLGTPYLWGGNSCWGIDCSGLVWAAMSACGLDCPGDSDQQLEQLGERLPDGTPAQRNDLFFWKGHVGIAEGPDVLIHANAYHMAVSREPLSEAITRISAQGDGPVLAHKRL